MRPRKPYEVVSVLERTGFQLSRRKRADHAWYELYVDGERTDIRTKLSHTRHECGAVLLAKMARELHLTIREFEQLIDCSLSHGDYVELMEAAGYL